jgi:hypothetical protein
MRRKDFRGILIGLALWFVWYQYAHAAPTYEQTLQAELAGSDLVGSAPNIPDDVEADYWRCYASAFVSTEVPLTDTAKLDKAVAAGNTHDPLVRHYRDLLDDALAHVDGNVNQTVQMGMDTICPDTLEKLRSY